MRIGVYSSTNIMQWTATLYKHQLYNWQTV